MKVVIGRHVFEDRFGIAIEGNILDKYQIRALIDAENERLEACLKTFLTCAEKLHAEDQRVDALHHAEEMEEAEVRFMNLGTRMTVQRLDEIVRSGRDSGHFGDPALEALVERILLLREPLERSTVDEF